MLGVYINFKDEAKDASIFYEDVFNTKCNDLMLFGSMPPSEHFTVTEEMKNLVMNASLEINKVIVMFSDVPDESMHTVGNNITLISMLDDEKELERQFNELAKEGHVIMPLAQTFWTKKYGYVIDKFGIGWQFSLSN